MTRVATSYSDLRNAEKAAEFISTSALHKAGISKADLAIVFVSANHRRKYSDILKKIKKLTGAKKIVGASGYGVLTDEIELEREPGLALMVLSSEKIESASFLIRHLQENNLRAGERVGEAVRESGIDPSLLLVFPDTFSFQSHLFFDGLESTYGYLPMIGGTASEDGRAEKAYQMEGEDVTFDAVSGLILGGGLRIETGITQSCQPFGEPLQITRSSGNMIYEMNGRPAYDIFLESLSQIEGDVNPSQLFQRVFLGVPLKSFQTDFSRSGYLVRNIMGVNAKKGLLACVAPVEQGEFITFAVRDPERAREDMKIMLEDLKLRLFPVKPKFGFYFNCCARGQSLYGTYDEDITLIRRYFPEVPLLGFFTYGEIAPIDHVNHLHHYSGVLTLVAE